MAEVYQEVKIIEQKLKQEMKNVEREKLGRQKNGTRGEKCRTKSPKCSARYRDEN